MIPDNYRTPLMRYVEDNLWSYPNFANQYQLKLTQLSPDIGYTNHFNLMGIQRNTPVKDISYLIFNLSGFDFDFWNFQTLLTRHDPVDKWVNVAKICKDRKIAVNLYNDRGLMFPRDRSWVMSTYDGQKLLAIESVPKVNITWKQIMYLSCYTMQTQMVDSEGNQLHPEYYSNRGNARPALNKTSEIYHRFKSQPGLTSIYLNGQHWGKFPLDSELLGEDVIEVVYDPSVESVDVYSLNDLENYDSKLDNTRKYLVHPPKSKTTDFRMRYLGDCEFFLLNPNDQGIYFNKNEVSYVRQLTHQDFGVNAQRISNLINTSSLLNHDVKLVIVHRKNDYSKPLPYEANAIRYLYRMSDKNIIETMTGSGGVVPEWRASELEQCQSMLMLRRPYNDINKDNVKEAVGYNAATLVLGGQGETVSDVKGEAIKVPINCQKHLTLFEYDEHGLFLRMRAYDNITRIVPSEDAAYVEYYPGKPGVKINAVYGKDPVKVPDDFGYFVFVQNTLITGELTGDLIPAALGKDYTFNDVTKEITWTIQGNIKTGVVIFNDCTLYKSFTLNHLDRSLTFSITHQWNGGGMLSGIVPANVVVIMNRRTLIENVDYVVRFPDVYIFNHQYLRDEPNEFVLYCSEWVPDDRKHPIEDTELGYVLGGVIGENTQYNLREDRVTKTIIDGRVFDRNVVPFSETTGGSDLFHHLNGFPYAVKHWYMPLPGWSNCTPHEGYFMARDRDTRMSNYLTMYAEKEISKVIPTINDKYRVFSPFMNAVVNHLLLGLIELDPLLEGQTYSATYVYSKVDSFKWWLSFDPITLGFDHRYFTVFPYTQLSTPLLTPSQYVFLHQVNVLLLNGRISMNGHFEVK